GGPGRAGPRPGGGRAVGAGGAAARVLGAAPVAARWRAGDGPADLQGDCPRPRWKRGHGRAGERERGVRGRASPRAGGLGALFLRRLHRYERGHGVAGGEGFLQCLVLRLVDVLAALVVALRFVAAGGPAVGLGVLRTCIHGWLLGVPPLIRRLQSTLRVPRQRGVSDRAQPSANASREGRTSIPMESRISSTARRLRASDCAATQSGGTCTGYSRMWASVAVARTHPSVATPVTTSRPTSSFSSRISSGVARKPECLGLRTK